MAAFCVVSCPYASRRKQNQKIMRQRRNTVIFLPRDLGESRPQETKNPKQEPEGRGDIMDIIGIFFHKCFRSTARGRRRRSQSIFQSPGHIQCLCAFQSRPS